MHSMNMPGVPFLTYPLMLHSSREYECSFNQTWKCDYQQGYWRFWYMSDLRYALPTVIFFCSVIAVFVAAHILTNITPSGLQQSRLFRQATASARFLSYRTFRIPSLNWNSAPVGVLALGALGTVYFFCMVLAPKPYYWPSLDFGFSPPLATRSGWLSIGCMPFVFATAGKSNFITMVTGVSHEKLQVFHRWIAYAFFVTALLHTFPFIVNDINNGLMREEWNTEQFYWTGIVALIAQAYLTFASMSPLRNLSYEWFKFSHFLAGTVFMIFFFIHCEYTLTSWNYFIATGVLFSLSWLHRQLRVYFEHGVGHRATVSLESNGFICVRVPTEAKWHVGQHFFVRFASFGIHAMTIHPFTACSLPVRATYTDSVSSELVFYIRRQGGFTARLARHAESKPNSTLRVLLDGPYGGVDMEKIRQSQHQLVIAGGSGAGWLMPMIIAFFRRLEIESFDAERPSMKIVLATRDIATPKWFEEALQGLLLESGLEKIPDGLSVEIYYTGSEENVESFKANKQFLQKLEKPEKAPDPVQVLTSTASGSETSSQSSQSSATRYVDSRPDLQALVRSEAAATPANSQLGVFLCGPLSMQSDVSTAVASEQVGICKGASKDVYLHMEHFSWA